MVPLGKWFHIGIACGLGKKAGGNFELTLRVPGEDPKTFNEVPCESEKFEKIEWLGFVSNANQQAVFYLDNLKLELVE